MLMMLESRLWTDARAGVQELLIIRLRRRECRMGGVESKYSSPWNSSTAWAGYLEAMAGLWSTARIDCQDRALLLLSPYKIAVESSELLVRRPLR